MPREAVAAWRSSARCLAANTTGPLCSTGGSNACWTVSSGGGERGPGGRSSSPQAARWASAPGGPKRPSTSAAGRAASCPSVRRPRRWKSSASARSTTPRSASTPTGNGARNAAAPPAGTTWAPPGADKAARVAARRPSATPTPGGPVAGSRSARTAVTAFEHLGRQRLVPPVVAGRTPGGEGGGAGLGQLHHRGETLQGAQDVLEGPGRLRGVAGDQHQGWAHGPGRPAGAARAPPPPRGRPGRPPRHGWPPAPPSGRRAAHPARPPAAATGQSGQWTTTRRGGNRRDALIPPPPAGAGSPPPRAGRAFRARRPFGSPRAG